MEFNWIRFVSVFFSPLFSSLLSLSMFIDLGIDNFDDLEPKELIYI